MPSLSRRTFIAGLAGATASLGVGSQIVSSQSQTPEPPISGSAPTISLTHSLSTDGSLAISVPTADGRPSVVISTFPEATPITRLRPIASEHVGSYAYDLSRAFETLPEDTPLTSLVCDSGSGSGPDNWRYLGETAPFEYTSGRIERSYHRSERADAVMMEPEAEVGEQEPSRVVGHRESRAGYYRLRFEAPTWGWGNLSPSLDTPTIDVGKTAYARARTGVIRNPVTVFERACESPVIDALHSSLARALMIGSREPTREERFRAATKFVQGLPYILDMNGSMFPEYPKSPEELLVEGLGDCEDKAILLGALLQHPLIGCDPILVFPPAHTSIAIPTEQIPDTINIEDTGLFTHRETEYAYIEAVRPKSFGATVFSDEEQLTPDEFLAIYDGTWSEFTPTGIFDVETDSLLETFGQSE